LMPPYVIDLASAQWLAASVKDTLDDVV
jgi:hypothetical protein